MGLFSSLTTALIAGRSAQKGGAEVGRQERASAEAAAAKAVQEQESAMAKALLERQRADNDAARVGFEGKRVELEGERVGFARAQDAREGGKVTYEETQRPAKERQSAAELDRTRAQTAAARRQASQPLRVAGGAGSSTAAPKPGKPIPNVALRKMIANTGAIGAVDTALDRLDPTKQGSAPDALGMSNALGGAWVKNTIGKATDNQIATRAAVADIGSQIIHDRSGAAVTVSEYPRLAPFIPLITDKPTVARAKLRQLRERMAEEAGLYESNYGPDQGFQTFRGTAAPASAPAAARAPVVSQPAAVPSVAPRKAGESPAAYLARTRGQ